MPSTHEDNKDVLAAVLTRAETDLQFRRQLLSAPHEAIHSTFGVQIPAQLRIRFIERGSDVDALVVLPDVRIPVNELSEDDLERVTGGAHAHNAHLAWKGAVHAKSSPMI